MQNRKENEVVCLNWERSQNAVQALYTTSGPKAEHPLMREGNTSVCLH